MLLFVYGTLRKGGHNHWRMESSKFVGTTKTVESMYMVAQASRSWPYVSWQQILPDTSPTQITGELYEVTEQTLADLDLLEFRYERTLIKITQGVEAYMYLLVDTERIREVAESGRFQPLDSGDWCS